MTLQLVSDPLVTTLRDLITSQRITAVIYVATRLGVADCLADGAKSASELAQETGAHERSLRRLLRALVTLGICKPVGKDQFELTAMGGHLAGGASSAPTCRCEGHAVPTRKPELRQTRAAFILRP